MNPDLTVVVVTFNTPPELLAACIRSVVTSAEAAGASYEIVVVDNASDSAPVVEPMVKARIVRSESNLGFGAACNRGVRVACGRWVLFMNPDSTCAPEAVGSLLQAARSWPRPAILGGWLVRPDGRVQVDAYRTWSFSLGKRAAERYWRRRLSRIQGTRVARVPRVCGGSLLGERRLLLTLGPFDDEFFLYGEDVDLCLRALSRGIDRLVVPAAVFVHQAASSQVIYGSLVEQARADAAIRLVAKHRRRPISILQRVELTGVTLMGVVVLGASSSSRRSRLARISQLRRWGVRGWVPRFSPGGPPSTGP